MLPKKSILVATPINRGAAREYRREKSIVSPFFDTSKRSREYRREKNIVSPFFGHLFDIDNWESFLYYIQVIQNGKNSILRYCCRNSVE